jgi:hypothetical protein
MGYNKEHFTEVTFASSTASSVLLRRPSSMAAIIEIALASPNL